METDIRSAPALLLSALALPLPFLAGCNNNTDTSEATSHITRAETYADQGQYRSALLEVQNAIQAEPDNAEYIVRLAELYLKVGASEQASELLQPWLADHSQEVALPLESLRRTGKQLSATETLQTFSATHLNTAPGLPDQSRGNEARW